MTSPVQMISLKKGFFPFFLIFFVTMPFIATSTHNIILMQMQLSQVVTRLNEGYGDLTSPFLLISLKKERVVSYEEWHLLDFKWASQVHLLWHLLSSLPLFLSNLERFIMF